MAFFRDCGVVSVLAQSRIKHTLPPCVQPRLALTKKSSTGEYCE